jgi:hypothetical protein
LLINRNRAPSLLISAPAELEVAVYGLAGKRGQAVPLG